MVYMGEDSIPSACAILQTEANALMQLSAQLDNAFNEAITCLMGTTGRIAVTGMGKSGLVGRKIAATLASTGSSAYFIHPGEASHGDMGLLGRQDTLLALSYSGNTRELGDILNYASVSGIPIIGITRDKDSFLGRRSTYLLLLPNLPEVDALNCAPTTSTTMQMALGDAIAITLMTRKGISDRDFHRWHPGGALGHKLRLVKDIMHTGNNIPLITPDAFMSDVLLEMSAKGFGVIGIAHNRMLAGIITDGDLRRHMDSSLLSKKAFEVMTAAPIVISQDHLATDALKIMRENKITALFVTEGKRVIGIIHIHDLLQAGMAN